MTPPVLVMKFGGTSVGTAESLRRVARIVCDAAGTHRVVVIASAVGGVTDRLVAAGERLSTHDLDVPAFVAWVRRRHQELASAVLAEASQSRYERVLDAGCAALERLLHTIERAGPSEALMDELLAVGERLSVPLVALLLGDAGLAASPVDAAPLVRTDERFGEAGVDLAATRRLIQAWHRLLPAGHVPVVTGFIGSTADGRTTTLGRGGSDYSAALFASALHAERLERWTDVDGLYTDDPRTNRQATRLAFLVLEEAWAWNHAGRLGMHRKALDPLVEAQVPVQVRSTLAPERPGTLILPAGHPLRAVATAS